MLTKLGQKYKTDKATFHGFTDVYHKEFMYKRSEFNLVLEIGTGYGHSAHMWAEYFALATVYCTDVRDIYAYDKTERVIPLIYNFGKRKTSEKSHYHSEYIQKGEVNENDKGIEDFIKDNPYEFDLIIDDGSHMLKDQQMTLGAMFSRVKAGGYYIIEDLHTSYNKPKFKKKGDISTVKILEDFINGKGLHSREFTEKEEKYLNEHLESCEIFVLPTSIKSTTAILKKRK